MSILILGGAGYIGSHTAYEIIENGGDVVVADNLQTGHQQALHSKAKFYKGDIRDKAFLDNLFEQEKIDYVIHFAADALVGESMENPLKYYDNNLYGTMVLLKSMIEHDVKKIVFSSTCATYGQPEIVPITESEKQNPTNAYGETKLAMEKMMKWTDYAHGLKYVALRYFNAAGAHMSGKIGEDHAIETHLIPLIMQVPNGQRKEIKIFGDDYPTKDGTCIRDYIHVTDLAKAHILAMEYLSKGGRSEAFNLGTENGYSVKEVIEMSRKVTKHPIPSVIAQRREGDPAELVSASEKAMKILGWKPECSDLEEIITTAWNWHKNHPNGFA